MDPAWAARICCFLAAGGERAAGLYALVETAKLNGLDPQAFLSYVFERISTHPRNRMEDLLPWHVAAALGRCRKQPEVSTAKRPFVRAAGVDG